MSFATWKDKMTTRDKASLINRLLVQNVELRKQIARYRSQLETTLISGKKCLEIDADSYMDLDLSRHSDENQDIVKASEGSSGHATESEVAGHEKLAVITLGTSAYVKMARIMGFSQRDDQETTTNMLLEAIMEWNIANEHETSGPELILDHFGLKAEPFNLTLVPHFADRRELPFLPVMATANAIVISACTPRLRRSRCMLREELPKTWQRYDLKEPTINLAQGFRIPSIKTDPRTMLRLRPSMTDICLYEGVESVLHDHTNLELDKDCLHSYPDLVETMQQNGRVHMASATDLNEPGCSQQSNNEQRIPSHDDGGSTADNYNCRTETMMATSQPLPNNPCHEIMSFPSPVEVHSGYDQIFEGIPFAGQPVHENLLAQMEGLGVNVHFRKTSICGLRQVWWRITRCD
ncbi:hypothetical protein COCSADRAFT_25563 [Bipolaris sorokiniana ND90Pr]|uniref:Uncharacterized protein n=1 Tax=Cochliobolus sativus (strain ND90Pr / ATCC 201652) TaxID=665912 RepID=M2RGX2_COCSN|nr:uncharacterized protein COCSADRAFT_25563 [Bipolaris sorokiniana ND90Pr]EMD65984.1 hypothetical protein COCSADRAFT_25563 [Bipolaris sorokiniana ND90Pr]